ncbi:Stress-associated endoplasmic reticulum protein [Dillenia turbinata]|uniref:Stress-associated endoplasmic reticulum protein n=1 Tax=Dillenia turbinata TaxID=194707 RepID=A0AAN8VJB0_9MAGN
MEINFTTSRRLADRRVNKFEKNITKRGAVPETTVKKSSDYPVGPILLGFFIFVVIGSSEDNDGTLPTSKTGNQEKLAAGQHEQAFVTQASHPHVLSVKLQAPDVWHSVNLLPQERHLLKLPYAYTCGGILCQQAHEHDPATTLSKCVAFGNSAQCWEKLWELSKEFHLRHTERKRKNVAMGSLAMTASNRSSGNSFQICCSITSAELINAYDSTLSHDNLMTLRCSTSVGQMSAATGTNSCWQPIIEFGI